MTAVLPPTDPVGASRYLRTHDMIGGYLPALALPPEAACAWLQLWTQVRSLDDATEAGEFTGPLPELGTLARQLHPELAPVLDELATWPRLEASLFADHRVRSIREYFDLLVVRAFCPVYACAVVALPDEDRAILEAFSMWVGFGAQFMDDTLDLVADIERGLLFVTSEEFEHLALTPADLGTATGLRAVTVLRNKWALAYYLKAYELTSAMKLDNRRMARTWLEFGLRALVDDRIRPLHPSVLDDQARYLRHFGVHTALFDLPLPTESCRLAASRWFVRRFVRGYSIVSIDEARAKAGALGPPLPSHFIVPEVRNRPLRPPRPRTDDAPDGRRRVTFVRYGQGGVLPLVVDAARIALGS